MIMRTKLNLMIALVMLAAPAAAQAADPPDQKKAAQLRQQLEARNERQLKQFKSAREEIRNNPRAPVLRQQGMSNEAKEIEVRIEKYLDSTILYSQPIDPAHEKELYALGTFLKVNKKEQINDKTVFDGRVYRVMRAMGTEWQSKIGQTVMISVRSSASGGPVAMGVRVKR
jgi:hypothetical protein